MIRRAAALVLFAATALPQTLTFSPQGGDRNVTVWAVTGCAPKAISVSRLYEIAARHGIVWLTPSAAATRINRKSFWSRAVRWGGFAVAATSGLMTLSVIKANSPLQQGVGSGAAFLNILLPLAQKNVEGADPSTGGPLMLGLDGCGTTTFYAAPSKGAPFVALLDGSDAAPSAQGPLPLAPRMPNPSGELAAQARFEFHSDALRQLLPLAPRMPDPPAELALTLLDGLDAAASAQARLPLAPRMPDPPAELAFTFDVPVDSLTWFLHQNR